jgi:ABC-type xylose transport system permease subunit
VPNPRRKGSRITRDMVLFVGGLLGILYETVVEQIDRPALLAVFAGMLGLPIYLRRDEKPNDKDEG